MSGPPKSLLTETNAGVLIRVFVQPKSSRNEIVGIHDNELKIKLTSPPVDGQANAALIEFLSEILHLPKRNLTLRQGTSSRHKTIEVQGLTIATIKTFLKLDQI